jgi:hypothetical protein
MLFGKIKQSFKLYKDFFLQEYKFSEFPLYTFEVMFKTIAITVCVRSLVPSVNTDKLVLSRS